VKTKRLISFDEDDTLRVEQIMIDHEKEGAFDFIKEVVKK
jgi:hypothetical protein